MSDHRRLQRTLFRMQMDTNFARAVFAGEAVALASTNLAAADLERLRGLDPRGVGADHEDKRKRQLLTNVISEYPLTAACAGPEQEAFAFGFLHSRDFHAAIADDGSLPLAFANYARENLPASASAWCPEFLGLEDAMARARRRPSPRPVPAADEVCLSPAVTLLETAHGCIELADGLRAGSVERASGSPPRERQSVMILRKAASAGCLVEVELEPLEPQVAAVLLRAREPLDRAARTALAREQGADGRELERLLRSLEADGALIRGS